MATRTAALRRTTAEPALRSYLDQIRRFPMLEAEQEYLLAKRWRERNDPDAAQQLVTSHLRLAAKLALRFRGYGLPIADVIAEANIGLMRAVTSFAPDKGFRLATYAMWWIRAAIREYVLRSWSLVRLGTTASQRKLFFRLRAAKGRISALDGNLRPDQATLIAQRIGVAEQDVIDMNQRLERDLSLNAPLREDDSAAPWQDCLVDESASQEAVLVESEEADIRRVALHRSLSVLNDRERGIFVGRRLSDDPISLEALAKKHGVSHHPVRPTQKPPFPKGHDAAKPHVT